MKKNFLKICAVLMGATTLVSCLDDSKYALDPGNATNIIEFYDASVPTSPSGSIYPVWTADTEVQAEFTVTQTISYSGPDSNNKDIQLTLAVDPTALDAYNTQMTTGLNGNAPLGGSTYLLMPDTYYDMQQTEATIEKGSKKVDITIKFYPNVFDLSHSYIIPVRITSSSHGTLSAHYSVALLAVVVKNKYDGIYEILEGTITRNSGTGPDLVLGGTYADGLEMPFVTVNANTVGITPLWRDGSGVGGVGGTQVAVNEGVTNPDGSNPVTVTSGNATLKNIAGEINAFYPATEDHAQQFILNFDWGAAPDNRLIEDLKVELVGPRP